MGRRPLCRTAIGFAPRVGHLQAEPGIAPVSEIRQLLRYGDSHWTRTAPSPPLLPGSPEPPHPPPAPPSPYMKPMPPVPPLQPPPAPCPVRPLTPMNPDGPLETPPKPPTPPNRPPVAPLAVNVVPPQATGEAVPLAPFVRVVVKPPKPPAPTVTAHTSPAETVTKPWANAPAPPPPPLGTEVVPPLSPAAPPPPPPYSETISCETPLGTMNADWLEPSGTLNSCSETDGTID